MLVIDTEQSKLFTFENGDWVSHLLSAATEHDTLEEVSTS
jgi:hypothetical protein